MSAAGQALSRHWPQYLAEAAELGIFMLVACLWVAALEFPASPLHQLIEPEFVRRALIGLGMGLVAIAIVLSPPGKLSGAHFNPAFTLSFFLLGKIEPWDAAFYIAAQFVGGIGGVCLAAAMLGPGVIGDASVNYILTLPAPGDVGAAFAAEAMISCALMLVVLFASNSRFDALTPWLVGAMVACFITVEAPLSGMSMNPARSLASAVVAGHWSGLWIYLTAPLLGMLSAAAAYRAVAGPNGVYCCKLHHRNNASCIFRCHYGRLERSGGRT